VVAKGDGIWFTDSQAVTLSHLAADGLLQRFSPPFPSEAVFDAAVDADDNVWFDIVTGDLRAHVGRMTPDGEMTLFAIPSGQRARRLARGPGNVVWFTAGTNVGRVTVDGVIAELPVGSVTGDITSGPNDSVWFTEPDDNRIGRIAADGTLAHFDVPTADAGLGAIVLGAGGHLWFTETKTGKIGEIGEGGVLREFQVVAAPARLRELTLGPDGGMWFTVDSGEFAPGHVGRLSTCGTVTLIELPAVSDAVDFQPPKDVPAVPYGVAGGDEEIWITTRLGPFETGTVFRLELGPMR
jgi:virginiamycin B lyase